MIEVDTKFGPLTAYVAGSLKNAARVREVQLALQQAGIEIVYDWTEHGLIDDDYERPLVAVTEVEAVCAASVTVIVQHGGRGTHVELGIALGREKPVFLLDPPIDTPDPYDHKCVFYAHPNVTHCRDIPQLLISIQRQDRAATLADVNRRDRSGLLPTLFQALQQR
jgi:nucleoside 2-deoxyribosyltransferase